VGNYRYIEKYLPPPPPRGILAYIWGAGGECEKAEKGGKCNKGRKGEDRGKGWEVEKCGSNIDP
jgi:hypothetical protein